MNTGYKSNVKINFRSGDVRVEVSDEKETFSFMSGIGSMACHGNGEFYNYSTDGIELTIEHVDDYYGQYDTVTYQFDLKKYMEAVDVGFTDYLYKLEQSGEIIPLKERNQFHPFNEEVLSYFYKFSALINEGRN